MFLAIAAQRFLTKMPTAFITIENGRTHMHIAPIGTVINVDEADDESLVNIVWNGKKFMVFAHDLQSRAERVDLRSADIGQLAA